jgi:uncharacterized protein (TIGR03790 family)
MSAASGLVWAVTVFLAGTPASELGPENVFLLVNKNVPESWEVAEHYCAARRVLRDHLLYLDLPDREEISRPEYESRLRIPLRIALRERREQARVLLSVYGVPLRVGPRHLSKAEETELAELKTEIEKTKESGRDIEQKIAALQKQESADKKQAIADLRRERDALASKYRSLENRRLLLDPAESTAAVDSELSLLWWDRYPLTRWVPNMLYFQVAENVRKSRPPVLMVARLDGPTPAIARRLVDQAVEVEKTGLNGKVYVDARGIRFDPSKDNGLGYGGYDESLREMARLLKQDAKMPVTLDDKPALFAPGSCPECALYCGWYSLGNYVDCCRFVPGAVAYHIASSEAESLRDPKTNYWCKRLLEHGVAATLGPVAEPYTLGFPKPEEFFGFLLTGRYPLVECYAKTNLLNSWMTVLIGDPLYNPFAKNPKLTVDQVHPSPRGARFAVPPR